MNMRILAAAVFAAGAWAQDLPGSDSPYFDAIEYLGSNGRELALAHGKEGLIQEYQTLIDQYPDLAKSIQLATEIGLIHEWDLPEIGQPPNLPRAYDQYLHVIDHYDPDLDYMKRVLSLAANRALTLDPDNAEALFRRMMEQYPDDDTMQLEGMQGLARLAGQRGDMETARDLYGDMLRYQPLDLSGYYGEGSNAVNIQDAAAALLMADAVRGLNNKEERLAALDRLLEDYPELLARHRELVGQFRETIENQDERREEVAADYRLARATPDGEPQAVMLPGGGSAESPARVDMAYQVPDEVPVADPAAVDPPAPPQPAAPWKRYGVFVAAVLVLIGGGYALRRYIF